MGLTREQAIALDIRAWEWRRDNPGKDAYEMPDELYAKLVSCGAEEVFDYGALCSVCRDEEGTCHHCPLRSCDSGSLFEQWTVALDRNNNEELSKAADDIVVLLEQSK